MAETDAPINEQDGDQQEQISYRKEFLRQIKAINRIQQTFKRVIAKNRMESDLDYEITDNNARKSLIRKFIIHFERTQREPIINISQTERNEHMRAYCAELILDALRARRRRLLIQLRTYDIYKFAALTILENFRISPAAGGEFFRLAKILKIQRFARKIAYRQRFVRLKIQIQKLSDPKVTQPLQLVKLLDPQAASLLQSFGEGFALRFRLCQESDIANLQMSHAVQASHKPKSRPGSTYGKIQEVTYKPKIFYKIFLHQHVCDVCETAPRDYATEALTMKEDRRLWYMRVTNQPWRALNGAALRQSVLDLKPTLTPTEVKYLKNYKQIKWREKLTKKWILAGIGIDESVYGEEKMDTDLDSFIKKLDYKAYENGWKDIGTNVFSLDTVKQEIQKIKLEEDLEMKDKIPRVLYNSLQ